ncbi:hypothetical protein KJ969_00980 [Patescibacteria group bacterium]|nr:hypothetical protein [Patescibacteria group bacterium]MBU1922436.1 hypothetical protein [Patescibacteria group bacterium]
MYCANCGKKIPFGTKFCAECGYSAQKAPTEEKPAEEKKPPRHPLARGCIVLIIVIFFFCLFGYWSVSSNSPDKESVGMIVGFGILFFAIIFLTILFFNIKTTLFILKKIILWLFHHPKLSIPLVVILIIATLFLNYAWNQWNYQNVTAALPLIQDSLTEVAAVKIMGDSIIVGRPIKGASWKKIRTDAQVIVERLNDFSAPRRLRNYQKAAIVWANAIVEATNNTKTWKELAAQPGDFQLELGDSQAEDIFLATATKIRELKEFGDNAIQEKDRETMRYVAARLLVQKHWLDGILHSQKAGLQSFKLSSGLIDAASAEDYCTYARQLYQEALAECHGDASCITVLNQAQSAIESICGINWQVPVQQAQPQAPQNQPPVQNQPTPEPEAPPVVEEPYYYQYPPEEPKRDVCIPGKTASYCAEPVAQSTNEIAASAVGFATGDTTAEADWEKAWQDIDKILPPEGMVGPEVGQPGIEGGHVTEGAGITIGESAFGGETATPTQYSPRVQIFHDACAAMGSYVGGANKNKDRLPTTESGYHCNYKQADINCWDFLTYSGGRYMGGDVGCRELGLIPR